MVIFTFFFQFTLSDRLLFFAFYHFLIIRKYGRSLSGSNYLESNGGFVFFSRRKSI